MAAPHLRALLETHAPGRSIRELTEAAGVPENRLGYWLKPGTKLTRMPTIRQLTEIAQIIGCPNVKEVSDALWRDVEDGATVLAADLTADEQELLSLFRALGAAQREQLLRIAQTFTPRD